MTVGFVVRNRFQIKQFERFVGEYLDAEYLLYASKGINNEFSDDDIKSLNAPVTLFDRTTIESLTNNYDCLLFQTIFPGIELIEDLPLVSVQYGLAKERHNYGEWRALSDMNLMFGEYSVKAVEHFAPSYAAGNLKFIDWNIGAIGSNRKPAKAQLGLSSTKPTLLYMPTYGDLSSQETVLKPLSRLQDDLEILIKFHHNDRHVYEALSNRARSLGYQHIFDSRVDQRELLEASDVVMSDFSGAIFDAVYAKIPVILFQTDPAKKIGIQKFDLSSIEFRERNRIGKVCETPDDLERSIKQVLEEPEFYVKKVEHLRETLFVNASSTQNSELAKQKIKELKQRCLPPLSQPQQYVRDAVRRLLKTENEIKIIQSKAMNKSRLLFGFRKQNKQHNNNDAG